MAYELKTMKIKGKDYVLVNERIIAFRNLPQFKGFRLLSEMIQIDSDSCVIRVSIQDEAGNTIAQGMAQEDRSASMINKTSYVENCETSAVGRALGFLGIGVENSIATAEEVDMAIAKQSAPQTVLTNNVFGEGIFNSSMSYIKEGSNKPERNTRLGNVMSKYGSTFSDKEITDLQASV
jgi:hypothetical protein